MKMSRHAQKSKSDLQQKGTTMPSMTLDFIPLLFTITGAVKYTGDSRSKLYQEAKAGRIQFVKMDGSTRVFREELERYVDAKAKPVKTNVAVPK
jgi:excisionase family DNA binding protein